MRKRSNALSAVTPRIEQRFRSGSRPLTAPDLVALEELFRRLVLAALVKAERLP